MTTGVPSSGSTRSDDPAGPGLAAVATPVARAPWRVGAAVLGAWMVVLPVSATTLALRLGELGATDTEYALAIAWGWAVLIAALVVLGAVGDRSVARLGSRRPLLVGGVVGALAFGALLGSSVTIASVIACWLLLQVPAAALLNASLGLANDIVPRDRWRLVSALSGAAPLAAIMVGTAITALAASASIAITLTVVVGCALAVPLLAMPGPRAIDRLTAAPSRSPIPSIAVAGIAGAWLLVLASDLLLSVATAVTNSFVVPFVRDVSGVAEGELTATATGVVLLAAVLGIPAALLGGWLSRGVRGSALAFALGSATVALGIGALLVDPDGPLLWVGGALIGLGFGLANGSELALALSLRGGTRRVGRDLGLLTAVTNAPYVAMALVAAGASGALGSVTTLVGLFVTGAVAAAGAAACAWAVSRCR